jgi:two-component sensor histidine kinase
MQTRSHNNLGIDIIHLVVWAGVLLAPALVTWTMQSSPEPALGILAATAKIVAPLAILYFLNYYILAPKLFYGGHKAWFIIVNFLLLSGWNLYPFLLHGWSEVPPEVADQFGDKLGAVLVGGMLALFFFQCLVILAAVGTRYAVRTHEALMRSEEERRKSAEAELTWLKNQLNPHFLFNTLNNISSLTQIDPEQAQDRIGQLSEALRYALYESNAEKVPLSGEVAFMENYIDLMALRCNEKTQVQRSFVLPDHEVMIAPLLFISLIENAFKHGVSARVETVVKIDLHPEGQDLCFMCENSLLEKTGEDRSGSGIGLANLKRRLELIYPGSYSYEQQASDGLYRAEVRLKNLL